MDSRELSLEASNVGLKSVVVSIEHQKLSCILLHHGLVLLRHCQLSKGGNLFLKMLDFLICSCQVLKGRKLDLLDCPLAHLIACGFSTLEGLAKRLDLEF